MKLDIATVDRVASLAKLEFTPEEKEILLKDLNRIMDLIEKLKEVDTEGVEPLIFMTEEVNAFREDVEEKNITHEEALKNAPTKDSDYIKVPKFLGNK
ncbi:MAG: Asp-tRNA(Asn)/Glu-tRNA(Gln) amidotransferase subunit GatC [Bacteroidia bacterium]